MSYRAVSDRIIIFPEKAEDNIDGVLIPDSSKNKPKKGMVLSVGPDCREVKPGYEIMFLEGHGATFQEDGKEKLVLKEADVLCYSKPQNTGLHEDAIFMMTRWGDNRITIDKLPMVPWSSVIEGLSKTTVI